MSIAPVTVASVTAKMEITINWSNPSVPMPAILPAIS